MLRRLLYGLIPIVFGALALRAETAPLDPKVNEGVLPATYRDLPLLWIPKRAAPEQLSGDLTHPAWKEAAKIGMTDAASGAKTEFSVEGFLFCSDDALYMGFRCHEKDLDNLQTGTGTIWKHDCIEVFLEPFKNTIRRPYHQMIVDANAGMQNARHHVYQKHGSQALRESWQPNLEAATGREKGAWTLELRIPYEELKLSEEAKEKKTLWRLNLCRTRPKRGDEQQVEQSWSVLQTAYYHTASRFGYALPETFASPELLEEIRRTAALPVDVSEATSAEIAEMRKRIGELGSEIFTERLMAADRLKDLALSSRAAFDALLEELNLAVRRSTDLETAIRARNLIGEIRNLKELAEVNDDTPPAGYVQK